MNSLQRIVRHLRLSAEAYAPPPTPTFLVLFINSICNMKCEHCFYWTALNQRDDLTFDELVALSDSLGRIENLNLSGGEPFLRPEFAAICRQFIQRNGVRQIYVPSNGYFTDRTVAAVRGVLEDPSLELFVVELSLDGMPAFHDTFRVAKHSFRKAMETYDALARLQEEDPRLRIHAISTATDVNIEEIGTLTTYLFERCPKMDHHNLAVIRGDRKNKSLTGPGLRQYEELYSYIRRLWAPRETGRYGASVEPMLQWAKLRTIEEDRQVVPCLAGRISGVVYANGDVSVCETHPPIGNLRRKSFPDIWRSPEAEAVRETIRRRECHCTTEVFLWSSLVYQPPELARALAATQPWRRPLPLLAGERLPIPESATLPLADRPHQAGSTAEAAVDN